MDESRSCNEDWSEDTEDERDAAIFDQISLPMQRMNVVVARRIVLFTVDGAQKRQRELGLGRHLSGHVGKPSLNPAPTSFTA